MALTLYRAPWSTNVERVALALALKRLEVESVVIDYADRSRVLQVSGQPLVPVLVDGETVVADSMCIIAHLDARWPDPPLFPSDAARRAELDVFVDWFNAVWKLAPNQIDAELARPEPDADRVQALAALMQGRLDLFAALLAGRDHLFGDEVSAADLAAYPFLKYARGRDSPDDEPFHVILERHQTLGPQHADLGAWIDRMGALPRA